MVRFAAEAAALVAALSFALIAWRERGLAHASGTALRRARVFERTFADAAFRLADAARDSVEAVRREIARAARAFAPEVDGVLVYEERDGALACVAAFGERFAYFGGSLIAADDADAVAVRALATGHRASRDGAGLRLHPADEEELAVPLSVDRGTRCVVVFASQRRIASQDLDALVAIARQASPAYAIARDREHDRRRAEYDGLTGLLTPRAFRQRLAALVASAGHAPAAPFGLVFVDTDHFKCWNDTFGHAAGDALLREVAGVLRAFAVPDCDLVARNGGDEFCIVFAATDKAAAVERADTLRARIASIDTRALRPEQPPVLVPITASIGVAAFPADAATTNALLERADAAMYHSKETGRDGVSYDRGDGRFVRYPPCSVPARIPAAGNRSPRPMLQDGPPL